MATIPMQIRIDSEIKKDASELFKSLGLDMSSAVNLFLHQCVLRGGIPFIVEKPKFKQTTLEAIAEAEAISKDPQAKKFSSMEELISSLDE